MFEEKQVVMVAGGTQHMVCLARASTDEPLPKMDTSTFQKVDLPEDEGMDEEDEEDEANDAAGDNQVI